MQTCALAREGSRVVGVIIMLEVRVVVLLVEVLTVVVEVVVVEVIRQDVCII